MQTDFLQFLYQAINDLLTQNLGFFDAMGQNLFRMFATILIAWYGIKSALSAASGKYAFQFDSFASLLLTIAFGFAMLNYYSTPIPGVGVSFHNLVTDEARFLATRINQAELQTIVDQAESASPDQVASEILSLQNALQASYQTTANLAQLSLVKYL